MPARYGRAILPDMQAGARMPRLCETDHFVLVRAIPYNYILTHDLFMDYI